MAKKASNMVLESQSSLEIFSLHHLKSYIDECEDYFSLNADVVTADAGKNRIQNFLIVTRKLKSYDDDIGPYDAVRLVVNEDGCYRLLAHDSLLEDSTISTPFHTSSVVDILNKLADCAWVVCLGIKGYSVYHTSIGYHLNRVVPKKCIPDTARDHECAIMYQQQSRRCSPVCSKCMSLKWQLARRKREHDDLTPSERATRQSTSSKVPFDILSPVSKKARVESMRKSIKNLQVKADYYSMRIERLSMNEEQNKEIGDLVQAIVNSDNGRQRLSEIYVKADQVRGGVGDQLKDIWTKDYTDWQQFQADQERNGESVFSFQMILFLISFR